MISLRDLASDFFGLEHTYAQTDRWQPGKEAEVKTAERRMRVYDKIRTHCDSTFEISDTPESTKVFKDRVEEIAMLDPEKQGIEIDALIEGYLPKVEVPDSTKSTTE